MPKEEPKINEAYGQINKFIEEVKIQAKFETRLSLIEQDLKNYVKETDIHKLISEKIEKNNKKGIQWGLITQNVIIAVLSSLGCLLAAGVFSK